MSKNNKVLVLSEDESRRRDMATILELIGEEQIFVGKEARALHESGDEESLSDICVGIVNGEVSEVSATIETVCTAVEGVPFLLVGDSALKGLPEQCSAPIIARL